MISQVFAFVAIYPILLADFTTLKSNNSGKSDHQCYYICFDFPPKILNYCLKDDSKRNRLTAKVVSVLSSLISWIAVVNYLRVHSCPYEELSNLYVNQCCLKYESVYFSVIYDQWVIMSRSQRAYVQNNYLYRFPVDYSDILVTHSTNEEDKFGGSTSSGSLLLRQDAVYDSDLEFLQQRLQKHLKCSKKKRRKRPQKHFKHFNHVCLGLFAFLAVLGAFFYWSMWLVSRCDTNVDESLPTKNTTKYHWV